MDTPLATAPPESIMLPEPPDEDQKINTINLPDHLVTPEGNDSDSGGASDASDAVERADKLATAKERTGGAIGTNDCAAVEPPDRIGELEYTENEANDPGNGTSNDKPGLPIGELEIGAVPTVLEDKPSTTDWVDELASPDNRVGGANHKFSAAKLANSPVGPEHDVNEAGKVDGSASTTHPADGDDKAEINESQDYLLTNTDGPSTDKLKSAKACQEGTALEPHDRNNGEGYSGDGKAHDNEQSSISRIVDYLIEIGTSIAGAPFTASGNKHDISTDGHVSPTVAQQLSPNVTDNPIIPETIDNEVHHVEAGDPSAECEDYLSTTLGIGENDTGEMNNASSNVQPMHGPATPGPIKRCSDGPGDEFSTRQSANNLVIPEAIEHKKTPDDTNSEPFIIVSTDVSAILGTSEGLAVDSSDGYSTDETGLDTNGDGLVAGPGPLTPSSTVSSSQAEELPGFQDELEEGEVGEGTTTVFHDPVRFNVKHPLINKWTWWYTKPSGGKPGETWSDLLREIQTFDSVEEFWAIYNNVPTPSILPNKSDYQLFKFGIRPEWEDPSNKRGGRFSFMFREKRNIDTQWLDLLLATIGETLEPEGVSEVQGVVANIRKGFTRISCWTRTTGTGWGDMDKLLALGRHFKAILRLKNGESLEFAAHDESASAGSMRARASFSI